MTYYHRGVVTDRAMFLKLLYPSKFELKPMTDAFLAEDGNARDGKQQEGEPHRNAIARSHELLDAEEEREAGDQVLGGQAEIEQRFGGLAEGPAWFQTGAR